jgi:polysaccharide export outer membrane protein
MVSVTKKATAALTGAALVLAVTGPLLAQSQPASAPAARQAAAAAAPAAAVTTPPDYVIGPGDVLTISYRYEKDMNGDYLVRPDGKITLNLLNDIDAKGLTPEALRDRLTQASLKLYVDPTITVVVKEINSRKVSILGGVQKPGQYNILGPMTVLDLIAQSGSLKDFVDGKKIRILRGDQQFLFNYKEVLEGKNIKQNIPLKPGDNVLVPE